MSSELTVVAPECESAGSSLCRQVLATEYSLEGGAIRWTAVAGRTLGVRWPDSWLKGIDASETIRGNQYYFNVRAALPVVGLVVHYVGAVDVVVP